MGIRDRKVRSSYQLHSTTQESVEIITRISRSQNGNRENRKKSYSEAVRGENVNTGFRFCITTYNIIYIGKTYRSNPF